jgi:hypothetical protein
MSSSVCQSDAFKFSKEGWIMKTSKKSSHGLLEKRLMAYSLVAGSVLAHSAARADVQKSSPGTVLSNDDEFFNVDFGGGTKFRIWLDKVLTYRGFTAYTTNKVGIYCLTTSAQFSDSASYAKALNFSVTVDSNGTFTGPGSDMNMAFFYGSSAIPINTTGQFLGTTGKYLGLRFKIGGNTHYGWVQVDVDNYASQVTINELAYEDFPGVGVLTGSDVSLPVQTGPLTAKFASDGVTLNWFTSSETEHLGFVVERRLADASDESWERIASYETLESLRGAGNRSNRTDYAFTDVNAEPGTVYMYRITDVDIQGRPGKGQTIQVRFEAILPETLTLYQNTPNPFNPVTSIRFALPEKQRVRLTVYNMTGQMVEQLIDEYRDAGEHQILWNGSGQAAGLYFFELMAGSERLVKKMQLIK